MSDAKSGIVWTLIVILTAHKSSSTLLLHEAGRHAHSSTSFTVLLAEVSKLCFSYCMLARQSEGDKERLTARQDEKRGPTFGNGSGGGKSHTYKRLAVVASLYVAQNNLFLWSAGKLDPSLFQVGVGGTLRRSQLPADTLFQALWQLRIFMTAIFSRVFLKKIITHRQWVCLVSIVAGVLLIQAATSDIPRASLSLPRTVALPHIQAALNVAALASLAGAAAISGLAGVLLEQVLTGEASNLWAANFRLSAYSIIPALALVLMEGMRAPIGQTVASLLAYSTSAWPWVAMLCQSSAGILVALLTKEAGSIANNITTALSIVLTYALSSALHVTPPLTWCAATLIASGSCLILQGSYVFQRHVDVPAVTMSDYFYQRVPLSPSSRCSSPLFPVVEEIS